jgi:hypothetical protein
MRALREGHLRSFTANHGQPKPLLNRCVLRMSCSSQALDELRSSTSPAVWRLAGETNSKAFLREAGARRAMVECRVCESRVPVVVSSLVSSVYVRLRLSAFKINVAVQVADVNGIRRTIIQTSENRKVGGSIRLATILDLCK